MIEIRITGEASAVLAEMKALLQQKEVIVGVLNPEAQASLEELKRQVDEETKPYTDDELRADAEQPVAPRRRGRPRRNAQQTPPVTEAGDPVSAPQEAVGNTSSVPAGHTPPAEGAQEEAAGPGATQAGQPVASPVITQEDVRAKLKAVSEKLGMPATIKIIEDLGYDGAKSKVKDIREEHYAAVVAAADKVLAA